MHLNSINITAEGRWCTSVINRQGGSGTLELCKSGGREVVTTGCIHRAVGGVVVR